MRDVPPQPHGDEDRDEIELTGLRPPLSPRARAQRVAVSIGAVALVLVVIAGTIPALRQGALSALAGPTPTATAPSFPGDSTFYFAPNPPWVSVLVDGRALDPVPLAGFQGQPLKLARGMHQIEWQGAPFPPLHCVLQAPVTARSVSTPSAGACQVKPFTNGPQGYVVQQRESMATLPIDQQTALRDAIQAGLTDENPSGTIQPGDHYLATTTQFPYYSVATADAPLRVILQLTGPINPGWSEPCYVPALDAIQPCRFPEQDCRQLCTVNLPTAADSAGADRSTWIAAALMATAWDLTDANGAPVDQQLANVGVHSALSVELRDMLVLLHLSWDGVRWQVTPLFGHAAGSVVADDLACGPARDWLASPVAASSGPVVPTGPPVEGLTAQVVYVSDVNPTDGCFVLVPPSAFAFNLVPPLTQPATFLLRFGVLLTINDVARQLAPQLPVANAHEQAIAAQLQALANPLG